MKYYERFEKSLLEEIERQKNDLGCRKGLDFRKICRAARVSPADMEEFFYEELGVGSIELLLAYEN